MKLLWPILCLGSAFAFTIEHPHSKILQLPFVPSRNDLIHGITSSFSINFSFQKGGLYANDHQLYPPSTTTTLQVLLYKDQSQNELSGKTVGLAYTLKPQPIHANKMPIVPRTIHVRVEFLDIQGNLVSPHAVAIRLYVDQDRKYKSGSFRVEPAHTGHRDHHRSQKTQPWVIKYWDGRLDTIKTTAPNPTINGIETGSASKSQFLPFWTSVVDPRYHPEYRPLDYNPDNESPISIIRDIVVPTLLGIVTGLVVCLVVFLIGYLGRFLWAHVRGQKEPGRRLRIISEEDDLELDV
ncbi:hypothetical protein N7445_003401 [Penicillium cf. griseofulvum]|nr:hypothetical protein N7445_003401 [Penicillium cf. griseofulvum]